jgi:uncharacterized protein (TIGR02246 family)
VLEPGQVPLAFADALHSADLDAAMSLYEDDAVMVSQPGVLVSGSADIRRALEAFFGLNPVLRILSPAVIQVEDLAQTCHRWTLKATLPDGSAMSMQGLASDILRRRPDGSWRLLLDNPFAAVDTPA